MGVDTGVTQPGGGSVVPAAAEDGSDGGRSYLRTVVAVSLFLAVAGAALSWWVVLERANVNEAFPGARDGTCEVDPAPELDDAVTVSGVGPLITADLGYGRGRTTIEPTVLSVIPVQEDGELPEQLPLRLQPLNKNQRSAISDVSAVAEQIGNTSSYQLRLCVNTTGAGAGQYQGSLLFADTNVTFEETAAVQVSLQSRWTPFMLFSWVPLAVPLGLLWTALLLIRRAKPSFSPLKEPDTVRGSFASWNGVVALVAGGGAAFTAWRATVYNSPAWGAEWPDLFATAVAIAAAAAAAAAVPLGFSSQPVPGTEETEVLEAGTLPAAPVGQPAASPTPPGPTPTPTPTPTPDPPPVLEMPDENSD